MNPGYLSLLLMVVALILFASGWKDIIVRGITSKVILLFFVCWLVASQLTVPAAGGRVNLCVAVLLFFAAYTLWTMRGFVYRLHMLSVGALLGSLCFFMQETIHLIPALFLGGTEVSIALIIGLLASVLIQIPSVQLAALSIGLLLAELYRGYLHQDYAGLQIGYQSFQDRWWLTVFMSRSLSLITGFGLLACKKSVNWMTEGIKRRGGGDSE
ncbi:hypothetical protein N0M98_20210 [Paenibacillus doosanensis]|uniref:hypothetical protein n=1 Tax=Paenibacillus doosanensis TaxID=1229154 RepID=UPI002180529C|nr:hypothetical protein [Paenibacillus doosanensis]MCS7462449.1 hypothetical protein [Paenibacillus doosanensis]